MSDPQGFWGWLLPGAGALTEKHGSHNQATHGGRGGGGIAPSGNPATAGTIWHNDDPRPIGDHWKKPSSSSNASFHEAANQKKTRYAAIWNDPKKGWTTRTGKYGGTAVERQHGSKREAYAFANDQLRDPDGVIRAG